MIDGTRPPDDGFLPTGQHDTQPPSEKDSLAEVPRGQNFGVRFVDLGLIDRGAMGEVHRCWDRVLGREVAVKVLPADEKQHAALAEARLAARLQHPGILTVYEIGMLPNGDQWLAMREVSGHTFGGALVAAGDAPEALRPLISLLHKVCDAMAYAHARGVVHRDLKPANIRVGEFGEVIVLDWGIAGEVGQPLDPIGTKGFMPPEQAEVTPLDPRMDVYALGQLLRCVLKGRETEEAAPLVALAEQATRLDAAERPGDARALATALGRWLDGADAREAARALIEEAKALRGEIAALRAKAAELREAAGAILDDVPSHAPIEEKAPAWAMEDEAAAAERKADACEATYEGRLDEARRRSDEVTEARTLLGRLYRARIEAADATNDIRRAEANEARLRAVDHEGAYAEFLTGDGELTLVTDPPGAEVWAARYVTETRRLVPESRSAAEAGSSGWSRTASRM